MVEPNTNTASQGPLIEFTAQQQGPLMASPEWSALQALDFLRTKFGGFLGTLNDEEKREYVRAQKAWIDAQKSLEQGISQLTKAFEQQALASLRAELKTLTGQDVDPTVAQIHTRYLQSSSRVRRAAHEDESERVVKVASVTLWDAACLNYDGLTGWSYPGRTGLADASYLDKEINATAGDFIALVRRLDIGGQLKERLDQALQAGASLGAEVMRLASAEFEFALIEALKNTTDSRIDRDKYQYVKRALAGEAQWERVEEMLLFVPHGLDNISWIPQTMGLVGQYVAPPPGDSLSIPHIVFSVSGCKGAFSFFPNRPGGSLRHNASHREACEEFHVAFHAFYSRGKVDWLYQIMLLRDCARLKQIAKKTPPPHDLEGFAKLIHSLAQSIPTTDRPRAIGYVRNSVQKVPVVSLNDFYIARCRANLQELANETPGFMSTLIELFQAVFSEILNVLLIPVPGALKGLGRVRAFAMFAALEQALIEGGSQAIKGEPGELLQGFADLVDLLVSGRLQTRLAIGVQRRHQRLYQQLSQSRSVGPDHQRLTNPQALERMLGVQDVPARDLEAVLDSSATSRHTLDQVWEGAQPSASLVEAAHRFRADKLIDWVAEGADPGRPAPVGAVEVIAPLLTQLEGWPVSTSLSIENHQGLEVRRYSKDATRPTTERVTVTALENHQFAYATPRRFTAHLPQAIAALLPAIFSGGEQMLRQLLAIQARVLKVDLFDVLTRFSDASRSIAGGASASVRRLLPDSVGRDYPVPAVITQLQTLHPELSPARLLEVLREHPLSEHQQTQLLQSQLQPEALYQALRVARQVARREAIVDGIFHPRRFNRQTQNWAATFAYGVLRDITGQALVVSPAAQAVPYISRGENRTVIVIDQGQGRFAPYCSGESRTGAGFSGADSFYDAILIQLPEADQLKLGGDAQQAITEFRYQVAQAMLRNRALDGSFYPYRREIEQYACTVDASLIAPQADALGLYRLGEGCYLYVEGAYFKVDQAVPLGPWRIQHPSLNDAYAPVLIHNGAGAWRHEWETPLTWDGQKPFYRLGPLTRALSPDAIEQIQQISGVTPDILRRMHVRNERPPVMLVETIERFNVHQRVKAGVEVGRDFFDQLLGEVGPDKADGLVGHAGVGRADQVTVLEAKVALDRPQMERFFFKELSHKSEVSSDPLAQVLQRHFPSLTAAISEDLVRNVTASERQSLLEGRVPLSLTRDIRWWLEYLRKTRAMEGVHLSAAFSEDSAKLILHILPDIDGWPKHLRVEVRERGHLIDSIGPVDGPLIRVLEPVGGSYQAYIPQTNGDRKPAGSPGTFLSVLLAALPPPERQTFGYTHAGGPAELTAEIGSRLTRHWEFAETMLEIGRRPWYNPPRRLADGRIGYPLSGGDELGPVDRAQVARMRELFPAKTDQEVFDLLENLSDSVSEREAAIDFLFKERDTLNGTLEQWSLQGDAGQASARNEAAERIRRCWRKEDSSRGVPYELHLDDLTLNDLPTLNAHFGHVMQLSVRNNLLETLPARFLRCFTALRTLHLDGNRLQNVPQGLDGLTHLQHLKLSNNLIKPNLRDVQRLEALSRLTKLDLSHNPIGHGARLNLTPLKVLSVLMLRGAKLHLLPLGVEMLENLRTFDLRDNQLTVLTESDLDLGERVHRAMNLHGNQLSQATLQLLGSYRRYPGYQNIDFGLWRDGVFPLPSVERWLVPVPLNEVPLRRAEWSLLVGEQMADRFFDLLWNLSSYPPLIALEHQALRQDVTQRIWLLIDGANHNGRLQQILFQAPMSYMSGGNDGWLLCLNDIELAMWPVQRLAGNIETAGPDFLNYYRALRRLGSIDHHLMREFPQQSSREACARILAYRIALAATLDLPLALSGRFDLASAVPRGESVNELRTRVLREEFGLNWPERVRGEEYWVEFLELKYTARFESFLGHYDRDLERALEQVDSGAMDEGAYLAFVSNIQTLRKADENTLITQLTQEEWTDFVIG
ncbi:NEL-type E3 ubiquitin ligase domain-containing protein [Pseudomonas costantinii]|uniref:RING-type E3 ubiquitin transferase n=1 Tax=Pseudomonas costantinii TaxID=168469 RepID=A0A1S2V5X5_9PSED|nr:NEL-type E3 ubiquitin ligase domain-containing protein [Pseudomonas costantinii]OIN54113.1 hypothetical protein BFL40_05270 [Pseudomonas costantinii]SED60486.1 Leucine rich repeat-containing protein [Pseudomonas costantinii]